jgi:hypothetical protein
LIATRGIELLGSKEPVVLCHFCLLNVGANFSPNSWGWAFDIKLTCRYLGKSMLFHKSQPIWYKKERKFSLEILTYVSQRICIPSVVVYRGFSAKTTKEKTKLPQMQTKVS